MTPVAENIGPIAGAAFEISEIVYRSKNEQEWSIAIMRQRGRDVVGVCWCKGIRLRRELKEADWFLLPDEIGASALETARQLKAIREEEMLRGYQEMAADVEGEKEAMEWIESHIGECL